ncbi:hypothetical protein LSH36_1348g00028 [Paralvinella palmiformis]|uniref:G-protein coupled receptors family 1 profile domain-containing protein n=1 Tax=Paralvinella palmiformis TaxID=53620 RepID=A0AAD9MPD2_9ANNE|nr:hypothetical protein LSH36_1348g00028 [Paralvinella palmiformis]
MNVTPLAEPTNATDANDVLLLTSQKLRYVYLVIGALGLLGNVFVVVVIFSGTAMRKQLTNAFIINQSLLDAAVSLFLILTTLLENDGRTFVSTADLAYCKLWLTKMWLWGLLVSSTYNLLAVSVERYLAVVHPFWHRMRLTRGKVFASIAFIWVFGPAYNLAYMVPTSGISRDGGCTLYSFWPDSLTQNAIGVLTITIQFIVPIILLIIFYARMIVVLRMRIRPPPVAAGGAGASGEGGPTMARARRNVIKTLGIVAFCFVFCWIWNQIYFLLFNLGYGRIDFLGVFYHFTVVMVFANCCINPFIYVAKYEQFQKTMRHLLLRERPTADITQHRDTSSFSGNNR